MIDVAIPIMPFVDGRSVPATGDGFEMRSPLSGRSMGAYGTASEADIDGAVASTRRAFEDGRWTDLAPSRRKALLLKLADLIDRDGAKIDRIDATQMGKPIGTALCNAQSGAHYVRYCAEAFDKIAGDVLMSDRASFIAQCRVPHGVVAGVASWNFPFFVALLKAVPAIAAGNCVVLKPSEIAPGSALMLAQLAAEAGFPDGVLNVVPGTGQIAGRALGLHADVDMLTFTGSTQVGKRFLEYSGQSNMKKLLLECGGKSPQIFFDDGIDLDAAADAISGLILCNQGQWCSAGSRLLVERSIERDLVERIKARFEAVRAGDPLDPSTTYGPIASSGQLDRIETHVSAARAGAALVTGGERMRGQLSDRFFAPTLFRDVAPDSPLAREEIFGPVLAVMAFDGEEQAAALANGTDFGLYAFLWTTRIDRAMRMARRVRSSIQVRSSFIASEGAGFSAWSEPAGQSGIGVEGGMRGIESYLRQQSVSFLHG
nr:aldehyde dehydrogenase family protein [Sphingomonas sp. Y57]